MSCRRADRARLYGCNISDVGVRGCERGCCPYPDSEIFDNAHANPLIHGLPGGMPHFRNMDDGMVSGRTGLYWRYCKSPHRPKFVCAKRGCRRMVKLFYDPDLWEYETDGLRWSIRPHHKPTEDPDWFDIVDREGHKKRCPSCGDNVVRVGSSFRIPKRSDEKAWKKIEDMIADGTDMEAAFVFCPTKEQWKQIMEKAKEIREERARRWEEGQMKATAE